MPVLGGSPFLPASPSPRRAWIEILTPLFVCILLTVALPTEGVD